MCVGWMGSLVSEEKRRPPQTAAATENDRFDGEISARPEAECVDHLAKNDELRIVTNDDSRECLNGRPAKRSEGIVILRVT